MIAPVIAPVTAQAPLLAARQLSVAYSAQPVLRGVDFAARPGAVTAIVGPNGCGKSTLLKALARVLRPASGTVLLDGTDIFRLPTRRVAQTVALLPQGPVAPEGLRVRELVAQGRFPHQSLLRQWSEADSRAVDRAIERTDLTDLADRPVDTLSGGQRQRAWIAMVLAQETDILLLDEPTTFLDLKVQVDLLSLLARIAREDGRTVVVVLHEINLAAAFADWLTILRDGGIVGEGPPAEVLTEAALRAAFDLAADVVQAPGSGHPVCIPRIGPQSVADLRAAAE